MVKNNRGGSGAERDPRRQGYLGSGATGLMTSTRRRYLRGVGAAGVGGLAGLAGCASVGPDDGTDEGSEDGGSDDGESDDSESDDSESDDSESDDTGGPDGPLGSDGEGGTDAGGTRPEGTGGPGVSVVAVDDGPAVPVEPAVEVVRDAATADHPPRLRTTVTNAGDERVRVGEGRAVHFEYVADESGALVLLPAGGDYPAEPDCWRLADPIATTEEYRTFEIGPGESSERLVDLYATPGEDACLPVGEYRFETTVSVVGGDAEPEASATWGFSVVLE
jgi:hypothetical protein